MQLKLDQDGFIDESLVDEVRAGLSTAGNAVGPVNQRTLKRNRQQFRELSAAFAKQTEWADAQKMSAAILDDIYLVTNKPTIAWGIDDVLLGLTFTIGSHEQFQGLDDATIIGMTADLLESLMYSGMVQPDLPAAVTDGWVRDELVAYRKELANQMVETDDSDEVRPNRAIAPLMANVATNATFQALSADVQRDMTDTLLPLFIGMMQKIAHEPVGKWTTVGLKRILFNYFVPTVVLTTDQIIALPDALTALIASTPVVAVDATDFAGTVQQLAWQFEHEATYPGYFSADKRVATAAMAVGINLNDKDALDVFADEYWDSKAGQEKFVSVGRGFGGLWDYLENERFFQQLKLKDQDARLFYQYMEPFFLKSLDPDWQADYDFSHWQATLAHNPQLAVLDALYGQTKAQMVKNIATSFVYEPEREAQRHVQVWMQQVNDVLGPVLQGDEQGHVAFADQLRLQQIVRDQAPVPELKKLPVLMSTPSADLLEMNHAQVTIFIEKLQMQLGDLLATDQLRWTETMLGDLMETAGGQWQQAITALTDDNFVMLIESELFGRYTMRQAYFALQLLIAYLDNARALGELTKDRFDELVDLIKVAQDQHVASYLSHIMDRIELIKPL
ncbi:hypothetical protein [uncultured Weissella sp.]|uniref:hypothetical protein n=1 Tax=uncultured Weissella sp. TaxID=253243 RepID=UPI00258AF88E|nr:hypothetical protein [uncultured Weissella sp.]